MRKNTICITLVTLLAISQIAKGLSFKEVLDSLTKVKGYDDFFPEKTKYGYIPVGDSTSKFFYWLAPSRSKPDTDPLVVWLQGGPGCSSLMGLFFEQGPFSIANHGDMKATLRPVAWNDNANMLFLEQPLGVGFSDPAPGETPMNREDVKRQILMFFKGFVNKHPEFKKRPIYVTGESYGGHWVPYVSNAIYTAKDPDLILKGIAIGNGWMKPSNSYLNYPDFAVMHPVKTGLTQERYVGVKKIAELCAYVAVNNNPQHIFNRMDICDNTLIPLILKDPETGKDRFNEYNINLKTGYPNYYSGFLNIPEVQKILGVDKHWGTCNGPTYAQFYSHDWWLDSSPDLKPMLEDLSVKVWWYNGDLDFICNWYGEQDSIQRTNWKSQDEWNKSVVWKQCEYGECKNYKNVRFIKFKDAGHLVPTDQIKISTDMLNDLIDADK